MTLNKLIVAAPLLLTSAFLMGQDSGGVDPSDLLKPLKDSWPTYSGDYSGKRYSALDQINQSNVKNLTLAWMLKVTPGAGRFARPNLTVGGEGTGDLNVGGGTIKASALEVDG